MKSTGVAGVAGVVTRSLVVQLLVMESTLDVSYET